MARHRLLSRAPAREALIDIQFEPNVDLSRIDRFIGSLGNLFGEASDIWHAVIRVTDETGTEPPSSTRTINGKRVESPDKLHVLQCRVNGLTLSRLTPYGTWADLEQQMMKAWELFLSSSTANCPPIVITRLAVRYINELQLPLPLVNFSDYLTCAPPVPPGLPQGISSFVTRVEMPDESTGSVSVVTQALEAPPLQGPQGAYITVVLDIDVFRMVRLMGSDAETIWVIVRSLRELKNNMFFGYISEKTAEMFE